MQFAAGNRSQREDERLYGPTSGNQNVIEKDLKDRSAVQLGVRQTRVLDAGMTATSTASASKTMRILVSQVLTCDLNYYGPTFVIDPQKRVGLEKRQKCQKRFISESTT